MNGMTTRGGVGINGLNIILGIWLIISPFILGFAGNSPAQWNNIVVGILVALVALSGLSWINALLGIWLIISPFALGFSMNSAALWNNVIIGVLVGLLALVAAGARTPATTSDATDVTRQPPM